ncbi:hypothetical protein P171DRAFT_179198 [Karstenula rhodostoma CBS 690.94]|uniref:MYND-type domain-containing protein n=1 Tax=Karstenula rhodostoma CBS 690.94 TaxID=1392251 RepID=A0A9P4U5C6_9PLEO|nr:hypothetical protein P171DRAFT_179198 [Karstenula rhodostoma CBS 690.94]
MTIMCARRLGVTSLPARGSTFLQQRSQLNTFADRTPLPSPTLTSSSISSLVSPATWAVNQALILDPNDSSEEAVPMTAKHAPTARDCSLPPHPRAPSARNPGEVINPGNVRLIRSASQPPLSSKPAFLQTKTDAPPARLCSMCPGNGSTSCDKCQMVLYCSEACRNLDSQHDTLCGDSTATR